MCMTCSDEIIKAIVDYMLEVAEHGMGKAGPKATTPNLLIPVLKKLKSSMNKCVQLAMIRVLRVG